MSSPAGSGSAINHHTLPSVTGDVRARTPRTPRRRAAAYTGSAAAHLLLVALLGQIGEHALRRMPTTTDTPAVTVTEVPSPRDEPEDITPGREEQPGIEGNADLEVGAFTFDVDRIARRRNLLFPFVTRDIAFERLTHTLRENAGPGPAYDGSTQPSSELPRLQLPPRAIQQIVDRAWSRRDRWKSFSEIRQLLDRYDGDAGSVPVVLRSYLAQNILQPYYDTSIPDPRVWVMLALSADHVDFIDYIARYVHDHPSSRATTDLLFLLDKLVQGNRDSLIALLMLDANTQAAFTRTARLDAYELLVGIQTHYRDVLAGEGLVTMEQIARRYDEQRLRLLDGIITATPDGYRTNDARYLSGVIHWRAGRRHDAVALWRTIRPADGDMYRDAYSRILQELQTGSAGDDDRTARRITAAIDAEDGRWLLFQYDRLRQFGYRFDTY